MYIVKSWLLVLAYNNVCTQHQELQLSTLTVRELWTSHKWHCAPNDPRLGPSRRNLNAQNDALIRSYSAPWLAYGHLEMRFSIGSRLLASADDDLQ